MASRKADKLDLLINSAIDVFAEKGFHETKIKDITDKASLAAGTFYTYFKNKDDLLNVILKKYTTIILEELEQVASSNLDPKIKLIQFMHKSIDCIYENKAFFKIHIEHTHTNRSLPPVSQYKDLIDRYYTAAEKILNEGIKNQTFNQNINPIVAARCLRGITIMPYINFILIHPELEPDKETFYNSITQLFLEGIINAD